MFGKFLMRTFVGMLVAFPIFLASGVYQGDGLSGGNPLMFLLVLIICTCGLSLLVIIPACYLIGLVCTIWFVPFGKPHSSHGRRRRHSNEMSGSSKELRHPPGSRTYDAFIEYVAWATKRGLSREQIRAHCVAAGWPEAVVDTEIEAVNKQKPYDY